MTRFRRRKPESVYFYTFHKCASSLFSDYLLKHISGLRHRDYSTMIYNGRLRRPVEFVERGYVYGPLRLSAPKEGEVYRRVIAPTANRDFVRDKVCVFLVRDPRDILVSSYHSFGFTHPLSTAEDVREQQLELRARVQSMSVDDYALSQSAERRDDFACLHDLHTACRRGVLLRYEDMVNDFDRFAQGLCRYLDITTRVLRNLERRTRPRVEVDASQHRRSGRPEQFRDTLSAATLSSLNEQLADTLKVFGYEP